MNKQSFFLRSLIKQRIFLECEIFLNSNQLSTFYVKTIIYVMEIEKYKIDVSFKTASQMRNIKQVYYVLST